MSLFKGPENENRRKITLTIIFIVAVCMILYFCIFRYEGLGNAFSNLFTIMRPIIIGIVLAYLLTPLYNLLTRKFLSVKLIGNWSGGKVFTKVISITICLCLILALIILFFVLLVPSLYSSATTFINSLSGYVDNIQTFINTYFSFNPSLQEFLSTWLSTGYTNLDEWIRDNLTPNTSSPQEFMHWLLNDVIPQISTVLTNVTTVIKNVVVFIVDCLVGFIVAAYLLATKETLATQAKKIQYALFSKKTANAIIDEVRHDNRIFIGFIVGKIIDSFIIAMITLVAMLLMNMPYVGIITFVIGITNIIPFFGPFIGAIPSAILIFLVDPIKAVYFVIYIICVQQFDGNILGPKILGDYVGLPGFWVIFSILLFGGLWGFVGMVIGVPLFAIIYSAIRRFTNYLLSKKDMPTDTKFYGSDENLKATKQQASEASQPDGQ